MPKLSKSAIWCVIALLALAIDPRAEAQYPPAPSADPSPTAPALPRAFTYPPSWYYNPYTQGYSACPQGEGRDGPGYCRQAMPPTLPLR